MKIEIEIKIKTKIKIKKYYKDQSVPYTYTNSRNLHVYRIIAG